MKIKFKKKTFGKEICLCLFTAEARLPHDIVAPRSIQDLPEKLLTSGIYLPGNVCVINVRRLYYLLSNIQVIR